MPEAGASEPSGLLYYSVVVFAAALVLGGGTSSPSWAEAGVQLLSLPLLVAAAWKLWRHPSSVEARPAIVLLAAVVAVPILQLAKLPPSVWTALAGREEFAAVYVNAGMRPPWLPISLDPGATWRTALTLLPPVSIFLATLTLGRRARRFPVVALMAFGFASAVLALAQVFQGSKEAETAAFFVNRNHFAALLYSVIPFAAAWAIGLAADRRPQMMVGLALCLLLFVTSILGIGISRSRAGLAVSMIVVVASLGLAGTGNEESERKRGRLLVIGAAFAAVLLVIQFALLGLLQRLGYSVGENARWDFAEKTFYAAIEYFPFGTGLGTFVDIYRMHQSTTDLESFFVNHAHNDYLELWLEGGVLAIVLLLIFFAWFVMSALRVWRKTAQGRGSALDGAIARAGVIAAVALLLHSTVDYPLRTTALAVVFALSCALLVPPPETSRRRLVGDRGGGRSKRASSTGEVGTIPLRRNRQRPSGLSGSYFD